MRLRILLVCCAALALTVGVVTATAGNGGTKGPGGCNLAPGSDISQDAQQPGPNAGPNGTTTWFVAPGAPSSPGQAVKFVCIEGN
jgi:hypothetical protein